MCKSFESPSELNSDVHVGKVKKHNKLLPVHMWGMARPKDILVLKNQAECYQVALCGLFSTTVKDAKKHQWDRMQA